MVLAADRERGFLRMEISTSRSSAVRNVIGRSTEKPGSVAAPIPGLVHFEQAGRSRLGMIAFLKDLVDGVPKANHYTLGVVCALDVPTRPLYRKTS